MKKKEDNFQCQHCGQIRLIEYEIRDKKSLYDYFWCPSCEEETPHLWIGKDILDKYLYYNSDLDDRYY